MAPGWCMFIMGQNLCNICRGERANSLRQASPATSLGEGGKGQESTPFGSLLEGAVRVAD